MHSHEGVTLTCGQRHQCPVDVLMLFIGELDALPVCVLEVRRHRAAVVPSGVDAHRLGASIPPRRLLVLAVRDVGRNHMQPRRELGLRGIEAVAVLPDAGLHIGNEVVEIGVAVAKLPANVGDQAGRLHQQVADIASGCLNLRRSWGFRRVSHRRG